MCIDFGPLETRLKVGRRLRGFAAFIYRATSFVLGTRKWDGCFVAEIDRSKIVLPNNPWESEGADQKTAPANDYLQQKLSDEQVIPRSSPPWRPNPSENEILRPTDPFAPRPSEQSTSTPSNDKPAEQKSPSPQAERPTAKAPAEQAQPAGRDNKIQLGPNVDVTLPNLPDFWIINKNDPKPHNAAELPKQNEDQQQPKDLPPFNPFNDPSFKPLRPSEGAWWNKNKPQPLPKEIFQPTDNTNGGGPRVQSAEKVVEFRNMRWRSADHGNLPDALIRLPKNFDSSKPINLVVYNHGYRDSIQSALVNAELGRQMDLAPPNTVLVLPEWQKFPAASNAIDGDFGNQNQFKNMLQEIFDKTPELKGKTLNDVKNLDIISHSGGDKAVVSQVNNNGLGSKITSITLLDSTYVIGNQLDMWLRLNIHDLANGRKQFRSIYNDTSSASRAQANRVRQMLSQAGLPDRVYQDDRRGTGPMTADEIGRSPIVYKYTDATYNGKGPHTSLPMLYIGPIQQANRDTRR